MSFVGIGYQGITLPVLQRQLLLGEVAVVCDVRLNPLSRKPGLSKTGLSSALREVGVKYLHLPALGNPKWNRAGFDGSPAELDEAIGNFEELMRSSEAAQEALGQIRSCSGEGRVGLLCYEASSNRCHRGVILAQLGVAAEEPDISKIVEQLVLT